MSEVRGVLAIKKRYMAVVAASTMAIGVLNVIRAKKHMNTMVSIIGFSLILYQRALFL